MPGETPITVAHGDGIGPEIMAATLRILKEAGAKLEIDTIEIGRKVYERGHSAGIEPSAWDSLRRTKVFLKSPITTPQGGGFKSLNVTVRKTLGLFANVRPCVAYHPFVQTRQPGMDVVIIRENEEDLYAGIEHRHTDDVVQCLKIISRPGSEKIIRYAFEYARLQGRRKVTCFVKDNIMKLSDGLFHEIFNEVAAQYPEIESDHLIIDIGTALLADQPQRFDVIVTTNLYGDIISDVAAQITGSVGLGGSSNVGDQCAMFEAIHGSAPDIAGQGIANPSGLILGAVMMLVHIGQNEVAETLHNAWLRTLEDGIHTGDIFREGVSKERVGTESFTDALIARLGQSPVALPSVSYAAGKGSCMIMPELAPRVKAKKETVGTDLFFHYNGSPDALAEKLTAFEGPLKLKLITNRGVKVWPDGMPETFCVDHFRCRFRAEGHVGHGDIVRLLEQAERAGLDFIKLENLYTFDGVNGFSAAQGE